MPVLASSPAGSITIEIHTGLERKVTASSRSRTTWDRLRGEFRRRRDHEDMAPEAFSFTIWEFMVGSDIS